MKTLKFTTLFLVLSIMLTNISLAGNYRTLRFQTLSGKILIAIFKEEEPIEDSITVMSNALFEQLQEIFSRYEVPVYEEKEVEEEVIPCAITLTYTHEQLAELIKKVQQPEAEVEDNFPFDTREIFAKIMNKKCEPEWKALPVKVAPLRSFAPLMMHSKSFR